MNLSHLGQVPTSAMQGFCAHLRLNGIDVTVPETLAALDALNLYQTPPSYSQAKRVLRSIFASDRNSFVNFDEYCDSYWLSKGVRHAIPAASETSSTPTSNLWQQHDELEALDKQSASAIGKQSTFEDSEETSISNQASKQQQNTKPGSDLLTAQENQDQIKEAAQRIARKLRHNYSRRYRPSRHGKKFDYKRTLRKSLALEGEPLQLYWQQRRQGLVRITTLLDVSASMKQHWGFFLTFVKGLTVGGWQPESFIFNTQLLRITSSLLEKNNARATHKFALQAQTIGGGTRIATSINDFTNRYGGYCLGRKSAVLIISDGYDADEPEELVKALQNLRKRTQRIIWLSPSLSISDRDNPQGRSLALAKDHLDLLAPIRTIAHLELIEKELALL